MGVPFMMRSKEYDEINFNYDKIKLSEKVFPSVLNAYNTKLMEVVTKRYFINRREVMADQQKDKNSSLLYMTMKSNTNNDNENVINYLDFYNNFK
jgi:hypothetical protein